MRADARRNREQLLEAAIQLFLEVGAEPALDAILESGKQTVAFDGLGADATTHPLPAPPVSSRSTR